MLHYFIQYLGSPVCNPPHAVKHALGIAVGQHALLNFGPWKQAAFGLLGHADGDCQTLLL